MTAGTKSQTSNIPNSFQNPNWIIDDLLHLLTSDEGKVLWFMVRHILGWEKERINRQKKISRSMFENGYTDNDGNVYHGVGLSSGVIRSCTNALVKYGIIEQGKTDNEGTWWRLPDTPKVNWAGLHERFQQFKDAAVKKTKKAVEVRKLKRKGVLSDNTPIDNVGGIVRHKVGDNVPHNMGGNVPQQESNPLSNPLSNPPNAPAHEATTTDLEGVEPAADKAATERGGEGENKSLRLPTEKPKSQRKRDLVFDAVVETCFDTNPFNRTEVEQLGSRVAKMSNTLKRVYKASLNEQQLADKLRAFKLYWIGKGLSMPQNEASLLPNFKKFLGNDKPKPEESGGEIITPATPTHDPNCPHCKGKGYIRLNPDNPLSDMKPCACRAHGGAK